MLNYSTLVFAAVKLHQNVRREFLEAYNGSSREFLAGQITPQTADSVMWSDKCSIILRCTFEISRRMTRICNGQSVKHLQVAFLHMSVA